MTKAKIFFWLSLFFIGGVTAASFYYPKLVKDFYILELLVFNLIGLFIFYKNKKSRVVLWALIFFILGMYLTTLQLQKIKNLNMDGERFSGEAMIIKEPEDRGKYQRLVIIPQAGTSEFKNKAPRFFLNVFNRDNYAYGDILKIECLLKFPENFTPDFDYRMQLAKDGIFYECQKPKIEKLGINKGNSTYEIIIGLKKKFNAKIAENIPAPEAGLLSGLLLGGDDLLSKSWQEKFSLTGMTHIVAVSGYNVAIIAEYLMLLGIFLGLWRSQAFYAATLGIILFVIMIGLPSSAVRAGIMGVLLIWAMKNGRLANSQNAILCSAGIMLMANPLLLRWDVGFQLSFLATLGIIYIYPILHNYLITKNSAKPISIMLEILLLTLAAQIFVLPIILYNFKQLSLISPLANLLVLPIIPLAMLLGFIVIILSFIFSPLTVIFSWLAYLPLKYETLVIDYLSSLKYASVELGLSWLGVVMWYIILVVIILAVKKKNQKNSVS